MTCFRRPGLWAAPAVQSPDPSSPAASGPSSWQAVLQALEASRGKVYGTGGAAERLGLKPTTLQSRMKKLGITRIEGYR